MIQFQFVDENKCYRGHMAGIHIVCVFGVPMRILDTLLRNKKDSVAGMLFKSLLVTQCKKHRNKNIRELQGHSSNKK